MNITEVCQVPVDADCITSGNVDVVYAAAPNVILLQWRVKLQHYIISIMHTLHISHRIVIGSICYNLHFAQINICAL